MLLRKVLLGSMTALAVLSGCDAVDPKVQSRVVRDGAEFWLALQGVRLGRQRGALPTNEVVTIRLRAGCYQADKGIVLTAEDSHLRLEGEKGAVIDGGIKLPPFWTGMDGVWRVKVPEGVVPQQLYVNDRRADVARTPNQGRSFYMRSPVKTANKQAFQVYETETNLFAALTARDCETLRIVLPQAFDLGYSAFGRYDSSSATVWLKTPATRYLFEFGKYAPRYQLEDYRGALDAPGEWWFDREAGEVLYLPLPGEDIRTAQAFVGGIETILRIDGAVDVKVSGLTFEHAGWTMPRDGIKNVQAGHTCRNAAVELSGVSRVDFSDCRIRHSGMHALRLSDGTHDSVVERCLVEDFGGGGIYLGDYRIDKWKSDYSDVVRSVAVRDCIVRDGGWTLEGGVGILLAQTRECEISHNTVCGINYTGISSGWTWSQTIETPVRNNRICDNEIRHIGGRLCDQGAIYTLGRHLGTEFSGNWIHDLDGYRWGLSPTVGIYLDQGTTGIRIASNIIERVRYGSVHQNFGADNLFVNNVFADGGDAPVWRGNSRPEHNFAFSNNCFATCSDRSKMFARRDHFGFRIFFGTSESDLRADACDGSGFKPFDCRMTAGVRGSEFWRDEARRDVPSRFTETEEPPLWQPLSYGYDDLRHDDGKRFFVHDLRNPRVGKACRIVFDVEVDEGASPIFEIRDWQHGFVYYDAVNMPLKTGHYEITATFDTDKACLWTVNGEVRVSLSANFRLMTWLGFVSSPAEKEKWRLTNFRYEVKP